MSLKYLIKQRIGSDKNPTLLRFDPINGTEHPVDELFTDTVILDWIDEHVETIEAIVGERGEQLHVKYSLGTNHSEVAIGDDLRLIVTDEIDKIADNGTEHPVEPVENINFKTREEAQSFVEKHLKPVIPESDPIYFVNIKDNLDFFELVDKFKDTHNLGGGQSADGTFYLRGVLTTKG